MLSLDTALSQISKSMLMSNKKKIFLIHMHFLSALILFEIKNKQN